MTKKVSARFLHPFISRLRLLDVDPLEIARAAGLSDDDVSDSGWVMTYQVRRFLELGADRSGDRHLGLNTAQARDPGSFGLVEFLARSAATVADAFRTRIVYAKLLNQPTESFVHEGDEEASYGFSVPSDREGLGKHANEFHLFTSVRILREALGESWSPRRIWFSHPVDRDLVPLRAAFGTRDIVFGQPDSGLAISREDLHRTQQHADPALHAWLERKAERLAARVSHSSLLDDVRRHLTAQLARGTDDADELARAFHMSRRTLHRRLSADGLTYKGLVDSLRKEIAERSARESGVSAAKLSAQLGYTNVPAFLRAFKRWTGMSPTAYRRAVVAQRLN